MNSCRLFPFLRGRAARDIQLAESGQAAAAAREDSGSAHHSGDRHTGPLQHDAVPQGWFLPFTDTVEVVQSQEAVASTHTQYISGLWNSNYAKVCLARAVGAVEDRSKEYLEGK